MRDRRRAALRLRFWHIVGLALVLPVLIGVAAGAARYVEQPAETSVVVLDEAPVSPPPAVPDTDIEAIRAEALPTPDAVAVVKGDASVALSRVPEWTSGAVAVTSTASALLQVPTLADAVAPAAEATPDAPTHVMLDPVGQVWQTLNNCGPASVAMILAYYGHPVTQAAAQTVLRPDPEQWGMLPGAVPPYVAGFGLEARILDHGTADNIKSLLNQGVPVIVAQWLSEDNPLPHYRVVVGFDDAKGTFIVNDGDLGFGRSIAYKDFDELWDVYNNLYLPIYPTGDAASVRDLLGSQWDYTVSAVALFKSRPAWDALLAEGGPSIAGRAGAARATPGEGEDPADTTTPEPTPTPAPNTTAENAWALTHNAAQTGSFTGSRAGVYAFYSVTVDKDGGALRLHYAPDDPVTETGVGIKVYGANGTLAGQDAKAGDETGDHIVMLPTKPGTYLIQVFNYLPDTPIEFSLTWK